MTPETDVHPILQMCSLFHRVGKETKSQDYQVKYFFIKQMHEHTFRCKTTSLPFHTKLPEKKKYSYAKLTNQGLNEGIVVVHSAIEQMQGTIFRPVAHSH